MYIMKEEGLYQNKVTVSLASIHNCKMAFSQKSLGEDRPFHGL